jgi:hypothetical protein
VISKSCLGRVFNFKLDSLASLKRKKHGIHTNTSRVTNRQAVTVRLTVCGRLTVSCSLTATVSLTVSI